MPNLSQSAKIIRLGTVFFWFQFWFLSVIDKLIFNPTFLWAGENFMKEFTELFQSIGIDNAIVADGFYWFVVLAEIVALVLISLALWNHLINHEQKAHHFFFLATFMGLAIFSFFTIGDHIFGEGSDLLEHTMYWMSLIISWGAYTYFPQASEKQMSEA